MIKFETLTMPGASMGNLNPMPDIKNISYIHAGYEMTDKISEDEKTYIGKGMIPTLLPYKIQDGYNRIKEPRPFKAAVLENDYIRAVFLPELGGRLWSLYDKKNEKDLLYVNPVFQPGNLGLRNAWFSGGIEFNVGIKGHNPLTCSPMWCSVSKTDKGEVLHLYEYERIRGVVYSINAYLPEDSSVLYIKCRIENTSDEGKHMYWWSNIAVPETPETRVLVPAKDSFLSFYNENHYILDKATIPVHEGVDVSYPVKIPSSRDFFYKIPEDNHKWICAVNEDGYGLLQCSTTELKGRKLFVWGQGQGGRNWNEWLSEPGSAYIEIQAGLAHTQLEHIPMPANTVWEWVEAYTTFCGEGSVMHGEYKKATETIEKYMSDIIGNPGEMYFPTDDEMYNTQIIYQGSQWGTVEEIVRGKSISQSHEFPLSADEETDIWKTLLKKSTFPEPDVLDEPISYVTGDIWLTALENLPKQSWYSLLHTGVIKYAMGDVEGAKKTWEKSIKEKSSSWALRNLAMLYKNELGNIPVAKEYIMKALAQKHDCPSLCNEVAALLTGKGDDEEWLSIYDSLTDELQNLGRLRLYKAIALINLGRLNEATDIINPEFEMSDIKEGELSVSQLWFELYRRIYAQENGITYAPDDKNFCAEADRRYPLPKALDFRMHD